MEKVMGMVSLNLQEHVPLKTIGCFKIDFSCESSSIRENVRWSVGRSVGLMVCNEFQSSTEHNA